MVWLWFTSTNQVLKLSIHCGITKMVGSLMGSSIHKWCLTKLVLDKFQRKQTVIEDQALTKCGVYNPSNWETDARRIVQAHPTLYSTLSLSWATEQEQRCHLPCPVAIRKLCQRLTWWHYRILDFQPLKPCYWTFLWDTARDSVILQGSVKKMLLPLFCLMRWFSWYRQEAQS